MAMEWSTIAAHATYVSLACVHAKRAEETESNAQRRRARWGARDRGFAQMYLDMADVLRFTATGEYRDGVAGAEYDLTRGAAVSPTTNTEGR